MIARQTLNIYIQYLKNLPAFTRVFASSNITRHLLKHCICFKKAK